MNILIATHDLVHENCHLMPWRTVFEVNKHLCELGKNSLLLSLGDSKKIFEEGTRGFNILNIRKGYRFFASDLYEVVVKISPDLIVWPIAWREPRKRMRIIKNLNIPILGYFPGGIYSLKSSLLAFNKIGIKNSTPYFLESICQMTRTLNFLKRNGFKHLIALTKLTYKKAISDGWEYDKIDYIPPGKDDDLTKRSNEIYTENISQKLKTDSYYLFMGPPSKIRGIFELLKAFDKAADKIPNTNLVCLFRSDPNLKKSHIKAYLNKLKHNDRIITVWESLTKSELNSIIFHCHALVLPFLLVPSEVPITIIEAISWNKPVITTESGGTAEFIKPFGNVVAHGSIAGLAKAMIELINNQTLYNQKSNNAYIQYKSHPSWKEVSKKWLNAAQKTIAS
jgi:glycosyltransferase involved in cell wall biosynthesis